MGQAKVIVLATLATKQEETAYLLKHLIVHGVEGDVVDMSLDTQGRVLDGAGKLAAMEAAALRAFDEVTLKLSEGIHAVVGLGGGTGGEIALRVMRELPVLFPKVLISTLPFDPRAAAADNAIILVPTLADICGLNATLREILENAAAMTAGLCRTKRAANAQDVQETSIGITALGATEGAVVPLVSALRGRKQESTVFHSNGYGGAAFARFVMRGAFHALVDLTPHELTRIHVAGAHMPMPDRFTAGADLPRIVLPGALNFVGLGEASLIPKRYLDRPHYAHSGFFTHAKLTAEEMTLVATQLAHSLNNCTGPVSLIVPMGGFSHQDCEGGAIEDPALRAVFLKAVTATLDPRVTVTPSPHHICAPEITLEIMRALDHAL